MRSAANLVPRSSLVSRHGMLKAGNCRAEPLRVTEHGRPVALLTPLAKEPQSVLDRLIAQGLATPAQGDLLELGLPKPRPTRMSSAEALELERAERLP